MHEVEGDEDDEDHGQGMDCDLCHASGSRGDDDEGEGGGLSAPIFCGRCHEQAQLKPIATGSFDSLSSVVHDAHADETDDCSSCHPGREDQFQRDIHLTMGLSCEDCHGQMSDMGSGNRKPWVDEPRCGDCHNVAGHTYEQSGKLFKDSVGHFGIACAACHGTPHAIAPSSVDADNEQTKTLQGTAGTLMKCTVCHATAPGMAFIHSY